MDLCLQLASQKTPKALHLTARKPSAHSDEAKSKQCHAQWKKSREPSGRLPVPPCGCREEEQQTALNYQPPKPDNEESSNHRMHLKTPSDERAAGPFFKTPIEERRKGVACARRPPRKQPESIAADLRSDRPFDPPHPSPSARVPLQKP